MMRNYLCWDPGAVRQVINPFAEHIGDSLFRAVHSDWDLKVSPQVGKSFQDIGEASWADMTPAGFLDDFLQDDRPHALAAVLGETGSGKSHLVHWMRLNIKPTKERVVLVVRKSGTSLRAIVRMIINELPPEQQGSFLETLQSAGDGTQSRDDQKQQLLNDLAQVIREEVLPPEADEIEQELLVCLPNLFQDPHMRQAHFFGDNTVIAEIVDHIFAPSNAKDRPDQRRVFVGGDLPLGGMDFAHASRLARDAIDVIELDPAVNLPLAIRIINRNLDRAVARTLSFSGDRVEELMTRLRSYLKAQGQELVLLVEEFARLQGIDRALLQAITSQGDDRQCKMRTAIAVTTGFFQSVAETAYMRTTHIVDMDRSAGRAEGRSVTKASLSQFTARYLNAVRLGRDGIEQWSKAATPGESPRSKCDACVHQSECHSVFGEVDGYGLYPFTPQALWNAASRADASMPDRLNPRVLQNDLLVEVLDNFGPEIATGKFPPFKLLEKLGGITALPVVAQDELANRNPQNFQRWAAFLELYDGTGKIANLDERLRAAFEVPEIPGAGTVKAPDPDRGRSHRGCAGAGAGEQGRPAHRAMDRGRRPRPDGRDQSPLAGVFGRVECYRLGHGRSRQGELYRKDRQAVPDRQHQLRPPDHTGALGSSRQTRNPWRSGSPGDRSRRAAGSAAREQGPVSLGVRQWREDARRVSRLRGNLGSKRRGAIAFDLPADAAVEPGGRRDRAPLRRGGDRRPDQGRRLDRGYDRRSVQRQLGAGMRQHRAGDEIALRHTQQEPRETRRHRAITDVEYERRPRRRDAQSRPYP